MSDISDILRRCVQHNKIKIFDIIYDKHKLRLLLKHPGFGFKLAHDGYIMDTIQYAIVYRNRPFYDKLIQMYDISQHDKQSWTTYYVGAGFQDLLESVFQDLTSGLISHLMNVALHAHQFGIVKYLISQGFDIKRADSSFMALDVINDDFIARCLDDDEIGEIDMTNAAMICEILGNVKLLNYIKIHAKKW